MKILAFCILVFMISSCGTISSRPDIVPVDSSSRGAKVYNSNKNVIDQTPFFYEMDKGWWQTFYVEKDGVRSKKSFRCDLNWGQSMIPNLVPAPFFPIGTAISLGFYTVDFITGNSFQCDKKIFFETTGRPSEYSERILILPVGVEDSKYSDSLIEDFISSRQLSNKVISREEAKEVLNYFGINSKSMNKIISVEGIPKDHLFEIAYKLKATDVIILERRGNVLYPKTTDLFTYKTDLNKYEEFPIPKKYQVHKSPLYKLGKYFHFFPNSLTLSKVVGRGTENRFGSEAQLKKHPDSLPTAFSLWGLSSMTNPRLFSPWDYEFIIGPSYEAPAFRYEEGDYWLNGQKIGVFIEPRVTLHTPFGAFAAAIGAGPTYAYGEDSSNNKFREFSAIGLKFDFIYYAFFQERYFVRLVSTAQSLDGEFGERISDSIYQTSISIGYYMPHLKGKLRSWMPF